MAKRAPGFIDGGEAVTDEQARTEILAGAFEEAAGGYFERQVEYEQAIADAREDRDDAKRAGIAGVIAGLVLVVAGPLMDVLPVSLLGLVVAAVVGYLKYREHEAAVERIEDNRRALREDRPDGQVSFVSQVAVPAYLVQYSDRHMVFDGLNQAPRTDLELALVDGDALHGARADLEEVADVLDEYLSGQEVLDPAFAQEVCPGITDHRRLEKPVTDRMDRMTAIARDVDVESISVNVHANDGIARSVRTLSRDGLLRGDGDLPVVETEQSMAECEQLVTDIRGVEQQAVSGDMLDQARDHRDAVVEVADEFAEPLGTNAETVAEHFDAHAGAVEDSTAKFVCEECLAEELAAVDDELDLVAEILSEETGSFGVALSDPDLDEITVDGEGSFTDQVRADIEEHIPVLEDELREAYNTLGDMGPDGDYCMKHESVETVPVARDGHLFGEVWRSLYYEFRGPIMDSVEDLERESEEVRQNKEQKMIDLAQYEQIKDSAERDFHAVKADHDAAETIERRL
ncbi:MAG: hypothetical protein ABEJ40_05775 [Haloarculaceae archaeon]